MAETRKRPYVENDGPSLTKKRALSSATGSPIHVNGGFSDNKSDDPRDEDELERFQKGAIFRRMRHYARQYERSQRHITELEQTKIACEADCAAMDACWTTLVDSITHLLKAEDLAADGSSDDVIELAGQGTSKDSPELVESLRRRLRATQRLVASFVKLAGHSYPPSKNDVHDRVMKADNQASVLRAELEVTRSKLHYNAEQRVKLENELTAAENRAERLRSPTARLSERGAGTEEKEVVKTENVDENVDEKPHQPSPLAQALPSANGIHVAQEDTLKYILGLRNQTIDELEKDNAVLRDKVTLLSNEISQLPEETIANTPTYKVLLDHASKLEHDAAESTEELSRLRDEVSTLKTARSSWELGIANNTSQELDECKAALRKRDDENSRLRQQRDQQMAEINERKWKNSNKANEEYKALAESRSERISILQAEVKRLRCRLAAVNGDEDLLSFLTGDHQFTVAYVQDLKARLAEAESRCYGLNAALSKLQDSEPDVAMHIAAEAEARQQHHLLQQKLIKYESTFGEHTALPADAKELVRQLESKEEALRVLKLVDTERAQAESSLYAELEKLSADWEALDKQVKSKVFDLSSMEDRLNKNSLDKAKAENKFFSAMRDKEALENERKIVVRNLEKQTKVMEALSKSEKALQALVASLEKELTSARKALYTYNTHVETLEKEGVEWKTRADSEKQRSTDYRQRLHELEGSLRQKNMEKHKVDEDLAKTNRELEKALAKAKSLSSSTPSSLKESELQAELTKCMHLLKCSTCNHQFRDRIITKCMHTFCKDCVDARISHRQRKCPACNLQFAQSDVQILYMQ